MADYKYFISKLKAQELMRKQTRYEKKLLKVIRKVRLLRRFVLRSKITNE